jgi:hypothetical protein
MKLTLLQVHLASQAISDMRLVPVPVATAFRLAEVFEALAGPLRSFETAKRARAVQLGLKGQSDDPEVIKALETEMRQLLETTVDVAIGNPLVVGDFGAVSISAQTASNLRPFMKPMQEAQAP